MKYASKGTYLLHKKSMHFDCKIFVVQDDLGKVQSIDSSQCDEDENWLPHLRKQLVKPHHFLCHTELFDKDLAFNFCRLCGSADKLGEYWQFFCW